MLVRKPSVLEGCFRQASNPSVQAQFVQSAAILVGYAYEQLIYIKKHALMSQ